MTTKTALTREQIDKLNEKPLFRAAKVERSHIDEEARTVELAFSSEEPVERYFGTEILDHAPESVRLGRLVDGGPLLVDHDARDHVGVVESVRIDSDRRGRAVVRFGKGARASEIFQDVIDGIRTKISVGYQIHDALEESRDVYRVNDWEPFEVSLVSIPADASVGVGRSSPPLDANNENTNPPSAGFLLPEKSQNEVNTMTDEKRNQAPAVDVEEIEGNAAKRERERVNNLLKTGEAYGALDLARKFVENGGSEADLNKAILESRGYDAPVEAEAPEIGLTDKEAKRFSFVRAMNALANPQDRRAQEAAGFEFECSQAAAAKTGREARGILVPVDVLKRELTAGTAADGGDTVATDLLAGSFIDLLRDRSVMLQLATLLTDLNGNIAIPRQTGGATAYWVGEGAAPTVSQQAFDQVTLSPKTVAAYTEFSRKLMLQSSLDVEAFTRRDLATTLALAINQACINGSGTGAEPRGILNVTGIGAVAGGANGAAPTWANMVALETEVAADNADLGTLRYLTNSKVRGKLKTTEKAANTAQFIWQGGEVNGYGVEVTNQVPSNLTKGSGTDLSAAIFGNFADLLIGMWGGLDLQVNPYSLDTTGSVRVTAFQDMDIAVRHPESFAAITDLVTV